MNAELFKKDLTETIRVIIFGLKSKGTFAMSADNLWQLTVGKIKSQYGPVGTNAAWMVRQVFNDIIAEHPFKKFILS